MYRQNRYRRRRRVGGVPMVLLAVLLVVMAGVLYGCAQAQGRQVPGQPAGAPEGEPGQAAEPEGPDDAGEEPVISNGTDDGAAGDQAGESGDAQAARRSPMTTASPCRSARRWRTATLTMRSSSETPSPRALCSTQGLPAQPT